MNSRDEKEPEEIGVCSRPIADMPYASAEAGLDALARDRVDVVLPAPAAP